MKTPNFICLGAQKAGTTTLHNILKHHPEIYLPEAKEALFFSREKSYIKGVDWWMNHFFSTYNNQPIIGAFSPDYLYCNKVPSRIAKDIGTDIKLIIILRDPVNRAYSQYLMSLRRYYDTKPFLEAIELEDERVLHGEHEKDVFSYMGRSRYLEQIERYLQYFSSENILFLCFETDIAKNMDETILKIQDFLEVNPTELDTNVRSRAASEMRSKTFQKILNKKNPVKSVLKRILSSEMKKRIKMKLVKMNRKEVSSQNRLDKETKQQLYEKYFKADTSKLEAITGLYLSHWNNTEK